MSDSTTNSRFVNPHEFNTELHAVWYAANYYYQASFNRRAEYSGIVFKKPNGKYGITIRRDGKFHQSKIHMEDVPDGVDPRAIWHTHLPYTRLTDHDGMKILGLLAESVSGLLGASFEDFSSADRGLAERGTKAALKQLGHRFSIYLVTATLIKRYTPGAKTPEKEWPKAPPSKMKTIW